MIPSIIAGCIAVYVAWLFVLMFSGKSTKIWWRSLVYVLLIVGAVLMFLPFYWMVISSFKESQEAMLYPPRWWPEKFLWQNYPEAWNKPSPVNFSGYYWVSIWTTVATTTGCLITSILAAYPFAKMQFFGRNVFFYLILATMMVPGQVLLIPSYVILNWLSWLDTWQALVVPWLSSVFSIFLMRQFFMTVPNDLWDAAQIDGAGRWRFLWLVLVPLSKPVLITSGIFSFIGTWNSLLWPLVVTSKPEMRTLMVGLSIFTSDAGSDFNLLMAASTFCILPVVVLFFVLQRFFIEGIARSGLKS